MDIDGKRLKTLKLVYQDNENGIRDTWTLFVAEDSIIGEAVKVLIGYFRIVNCRMRRIKL